MIPPTTSLFPPSAFDGPSSSLKNLMMEIMDSPDSEDAQPETLNTASAEMLKRLMKARISDGNDLPDEEPLSIHPTRESWLEAFISLMRPRLQELGFILPDHIRVSIGFPSRGGLSAKKKFYQVWPYECSRDGAVEIFISPLVSDPLEALVSLSGALGYAAVGLNDKEAFTRYCEALGLGGKPSTLFAGDELKRFLELKLVTLGAFPGAALDPEKIMKDAGEKKQTSRMLKVTCPGPECDYIVRTTKKCLLRGCPVCPCGLTMVGPDFTPDGEVIEEPK